MAGGSRRRTMIAAGAGRILVLAPHPDDEVVACAIAALRARAEGARVFVLFLTTGVPGSDRARYEARVRCRDAEAQEAASLLGLEPLAFRDTPARRLRFDLDRAASDIAAAIACCAAEVIWVPAFEGAHQDHDAANVLAAAVPGPLPVWEFAEYNFAGGWVLANRFPAVRGGEFAIEASVDEARRKTEALACYVSERGNLRHVRAAGEACRPLPAHDYGAPPHAGRLFRERFHWVPFRHPRIDFDPSDEVYRDLAAWMSAQRSHPATVLD